MPSDIVVSVLSAVLSKKNATRVTPVPFTQHEVPALSWPEIVAPPAGALNHTSSAPAPGAAVAVAVVCGVGVKGGGGVAVRGGGVGLTGGGGGATGGGGVAAGVRRMVVVE